MLYRVRFFPNLEKKKGWRTENMQFGIKEKKNSSSPSSLLRWKHTTDQIWSVDHQLEYSKLAIPFP